MKWMIATTAVIVCLLLMSGAVGPASAGVEPSPFREIPGKLGSVSNNLDSVHTRLEAVLGDPPEDDSDKGLGGMLNRLGAMEDKLEGLNLRLWDIMGGMTRADYVDSEDINGALMDVVDSAGGIVTLVREFYGPGQGEIPYGLPPSFVSVLSAVSSAAGQVKWTAGFFLSGVGGGGTGV